jgi:hypothetical protein
MKAQKFSKQEITQKNIKPKKQNIQLAKKMFFKQYMSSEENRNFSPGQQITGLYNNLNFLGLLEGGFYSDGYNYIEIISPDTFDISQIQEKGFTLYFWIGLNKQPNNVMRYILKRGISSQITSDLTPTIGLLPNNSNLFIKILSSNQKVETMISNKKFETGKIYSVCISIGFDINENLTEISLYIDGILDSQISCPGVPVQNDGNFYIGKYDNGCHGFVGTISEVMLIPNVMDESEIEDINRNCWDEFINSNGLFFNTAVILEEKIEKNMLMERYIQLTGNQGFIVDNLSITNQELREIVKQLESEEEKKNEKEETKDNASEVNKNIDNSNKINQVNNNNVGYNNLQESNNYLSQIESSTVTKMKKDLEKLISNEEDYIKIKKFFMNYKLISTVLYLANNKQDIMELRRVIDIFEVLGENMLFEVDLFFITNLAKGLNSILPEDKKYFSLNVFFTNLLQAHEIYFPEEEASLYVPTESNAFEQNDENNVIFQNSMANKPFRDLYDDSDGLVGNIKEDFVIKSLYPPKGKKNSDDISPRMNNDLVNLEEKNKANKNTDEFTLVNSTKVATKIEGTKEESKINDNNDNNNENVDENNNENNEINNKGWEPEYPENWADGEFELIINHCYKCEDHTTTTRHMEFQFIDRFNEISEGVKYMFPNIKIIGNYDDLEYYGCFDVYIHGIGPFFDGKGRYFLFKKNARGRFPRITEITDKLVALSMVYGGSVIMEKSQKQFIIENSDIIGKKSKFCHDTPISYSEKAEEIKNKYYNSKSRLNSKIDMNLTKFICKNWGCGKEFVQAENTIKSCIYHPGVWQFGSANGYWPECWSCCEGKWDSEGCTISCHRGIKKEEKMYLCLNYGEINPVTKRPDSACGKYFIAGNETGCCYHKGYLKKGLFTCCGGEKNSKGCLETNHSTSKYPDNKAKLYFYPKPVINPGTKVQKPDKNEEQYNIGEQICKCDYFKKIKSPYKPVNNNANNENNEK